MSTKAKQRGWCRQIPAFMLFFFMVVVGFGLLTSDAGGEAAILVKASGGQCSSASSGICNNSSIYCEYPPGAYANVLNSKTFPPVADDPQDWQIANISGRCLHAAPFRLRGLGYDNASTVLSFSTTFTFALAPALPRNSSGSSTGRETIDGLAFILVPALSPPPYHSDAGYLGLLNATMNNRSSSHTFAVEFDSFPNSEFEDLPFDHVGIDLNSLISVASSRAGYNDIGLCLGEGDCGDNFTTMVLKDGSTIQAWITYSASSQKVSVTISPVPGFKPKTPLLETKVDLSGIIEEEMYVGFSTSTGAGGGYSYVSNWSFDVNGTEDSIISDYSERLPSSSVAAAEFCHSYRRLSEKPVMLSLILGISIAMTVLALFAVCVLAGCCLRRVRKNLEKQFHDLIEMENLDYIPKRYSYRELSTATEGFSSKFVLGSGAYGSVYKGILPAGAGAGGYHGRMSTGFMLTVAVKRMGPEARGGTEEKDVAEQLEIIGRLRHRNLVPFLGWCSEKDELLLVYEYISNGSLDQWLFNGRSGHSNYGLFLSWGQRLHILCGVAAALGYLHEEWKEVVVHRDVKVNNVMLDSDFNAKLGDCGLAAGSHEHYSKQFEFQSISVAGTLGYLAPEARSRGIFSAKSDVYSFGVLALEVATGRRSVDVKRPTEEIVLLTWVWDLFERGRILDAIDDSLSTAGDTNSIDEESRVEMAGVLQIGLICSHPDPNMRPTMGQVVQMLKREAPLLPIASVPSRSTSRASSFSFSFSDQYVWADHSVELGMIENSEEIKLIPQSQSSASLSKEPSSFSFVL